MSQHAEEVKTGSYSNHGGGHKVRHAVFVHAAEASHWAERLVKWGIEGKCVPQIRREIFRDARSFSAATPGAMQSIEDKCVPKEDLRNERSESPA
jgi:hypothetical protein